MTALGETLYAPTRAAVYVGPARLQRTGARVNHPLFSVPRLALTLDLIRHCGALEEHEYRLGRVAEFDELAAFHTAAYIDALARASARGHAQHLDREQFNLGTLENPIFAGLFESASFATGASLVAADAVLAGETAFNPAGGMHHAWPARAAGFSYFNDAVLAVLRLRAAGKRVLYIDIDAHFADGVAAAFDEVREVCVVSLHMDTAYAYPFAGGAVDDYGRAGTCVNVPLPRGTHDAEYRLVFEALWRAAMRDFAPDVIVLQAGTDILAGDPLGKFDVSTDAFLAVVQTIRDSGRPLLVLGGGGYHPVLLARCWLGVWALLSGRALPAALPPAAQDLLAGIQWDLDDDEDPRLVSRTQSRLDGATMAPVRGEVLALLERLRAHPLLPSL